ncbi:DUF5695 domain-containing protein, partial [Sphingobacterium multivorum]|uniref:DUF5695 domain-containing protein n=2 Tax=Sphingobacteriaceae TaxID=84566 RepID=UPI002FDECE73
VQVALTTASKGRVFLAKENLWLTTDAGEIAELQYDQKDRSVTLIFNTEANQYSTNMLLNINPESHYEVEGIDKDAMNRYVIPLSTKTVKLKKLK